MQHTTSSCRSWAASLIVLSLFLTGTADAASAPDDIASMDIHPGFEQTGHPSRAYRMSPGDFDGMLAAAEPAGQETSVVESPVSRKVPSLSAYGKAFLPDLVDGMKRIFSKDIASVALIGLGLTGLAFTVDHQVQDYFQDRQPISHVSHYGDSWGQGYVPFGLGVAMVATGEIIDNKRLADTGVVSIEALVVTSVATESLKYITHRQRPNNQDNMSFPSGHASMTTAFAASVSEMYDWNLAIAVPLFSVATFVGLSRIQDNMHYLSDVVAGMTLGTVVGMSFARSFKERIAGRSVSPDVALVPIVERGYRGIAFTWRF